MPTGEQLFKLAESHLGEKYLNVLVPKDNSAWHGPWDCAEFASWLVYQKVGKLYGCTDNNGNPALIEAYSGAWVRDAKNGTLISSTQAEANDTPGVFLIRTPPMPGKMGHIAISDGGGKTVEAAGVSLGVKRGVVEGRKWDYFAKIPGITYMSTGYVPIPKTAPFVLTLENPNIKNTLVREIQQSLHDKGFNPGKIDGEYGPHTVAAVFAFQKSNRLVADGVCGPSTAKKLGVKWPD